jgi:steroid delta-isomerase-like uncharacterized protein
VTAEDNKALVRRYFASWNANDLDALDEIVAEDVVDYMAYAGQPAGREGYRDFYRAWHSAFPNFRAEIDDMLAEDDRVATRWTFSGRHLGMFAGIAPTGRNVTMPAISIVRIVDGVVAEEWFMGNMLGLLRQLGAPSPP